MSLDTVVHGHVMVEYEIHNDPAPTFNLWNLVIEFGRCFPQDREFGPCNVGEIVVFIMITNVPG